MADAQGVRSDPLLVEELREMAGDDLRLVARYREDGYGMSYLRDDVESLYTPEEIDAIFDDLILQGLHRNRMEGLFSAGRLECSAFKFEEALMFHFVKSDTDGLFVTIDRGTEIDVESIAATCKKHL